MKNFYKKMLVLLAFPFAYLFTTDYSPIACSESSAVEKVIILKNGEQILNLVNGKSVSTDTKLKPGQMYCLGYKIKNF